MANTGAVNLFYFTDDRLQDQQDPLSFYILISCVILPIGIPCIHHS